MIEGWCMLAIAILSPEFITVEKAEDLFYSDKRKIKHAKDTGAEIYRLRQQAMTYKEIGLMYGIKADAVYNRMRRFLQQKKEPALTDPK